MEVQLGFYDVEVRISTEQSPFFGVLNELREDFIHFESRRNESFRQDILIHLERFAPLEKKGRFLFKNKSASVYGWGRERVIEYGNGTWMRSLRSAEGKSTFQIFCDKIEDARELAYLTILSAVGERLDDLGYHRVHALGIRANNRSGVVSLPSGGGKSSLAALLLADGNCQLYSDETPLISRGKLYAFPIRMALRPEVARALDLPPSDRIFKRRRYSEKYLYPISSSSVAEPASVSFVMVGGTMKAERPLIRRCSKVRIFVGLFYSMVIGVGVAQIGEHLLRFDSILKLMRVALSRLFSAARISFQSETFIFDLSEDPRKNARAFEDFCGLKN